MTALERQQLLAQTKVSTINSALGLKIAGMANTRNRNTAETTGKEEDTS